MRAHPDDLPGDVLSGGPSRPRAALVIAVVTMQLAAVTLWQQGGSHAAPPQRPRAAAPRPAEPPPLVGAQARGALLLPYAMGSDLALRRWYTSLPKVAAPPGPPEVSSVFRIRNSPGFAAGRHFRAVAQVRSARGWGDVVRGDIGAGHVDVSGTRVAFPVDEAGVAETRIRTWVYVVRVRDAVVLRTLAIPREVMVSGWFGNNVVVDRSAIGRPPVLLPAARRGTPLELGHEVGIAPGGSGDVQFLGADLVHCLTGWRLGIVPHLSSDACPGDALMAMSPSGRWAVTRDLHWLDRSTARATQLIDGPSVWPVDSVDFVDQRRALVVVRGLGQRLTVLCSAHGTCARVR